MHKTNLTVILLIVSIMISITGCNNKLKEPTGSNQDITVVNNHDKSHMDSSLSTEERVSLLMKQMTLEDKIAQMMQGERAVVTGEELIDIGLGSILSGGGSYPGNNTLEDWSDLFYTLQDSALQSKHQIPMLYGIDAVHGLALVPSAVVYPHNIGLGAANDPELMYQMGAAVAEEMKLIHVYWNFSPCVAIGIDPRWGRTYECYSSETDIVTKLAGAYLEGQKDHNIIGTVKHYVADGGTIFGTGEGDFLIDRGNAIMSEELLRSIHLQPYKELVEAGVKVVMASFSSYNGVKVHENKYLLTDILKKELNFQGIIVSDWEAINGLSGDNFEENLVLAVNAGVDLFMEPYNYKEAINGIIDGVNQDKISIDRIDDAVSRILTVKMDMGLFEDPYMEQIPHKISELGTKGYRDLAKKLVEKSLVLLKNENDILPLKAGQKIYVTGPAIDDMGLQCGGWGTTWQGSLDEGGNKVTEGYTILEGLLKYADTYNLEIITDESKAEEADVIILGIGEVPYAEFEGDTMDLSIVGAKAHPENQKSIEYVKTLNKPVVTLLVAGRNVIINDYIEDWDSIVMCYLPGSQGEGIASVLTGEALFTGKLPMPYYKSTEDIGTNHPELLYEVGYGLEYTAK